jgi:hypothetical protein
MTIGPIQLIAITFKDFAPQGKILPELLSLNELGTIRIIDLQFVQKNSEGQLSEMEMSGLSPEEKQRYGAVLKGLLNADAANAVSGDMDDVITAIGQSYGLSLADFRSVAEQLIPNSAAALLLIEHAWARKFGEAVRKAGGRMAAQGFLTPQTLALVGKELETQVQTAEAIARSRAIQVEAAQRAARAVALSRAIQEEAADRAVAALVAANLIEEAAMDHAVQVVMAAELVEEAAVAEAQAVVMAAEEVKAAAIIGAVRALIASQIIQEEAAEAAVEALVAADLIEAEEKQEVLTDLTTPSNE